MTKANPIEKNLSKENTKEAQNYPLLLLGDNFSGFSYKRWWRIFIWIIKSWKIKITQTRQEDGKPKIKELMAN